MKKTITPFEELFKNTDDLRVLEDGIYTVFNKADVPSDYDSKAGVYDWLIGNPLYNRLIWGNWPSQYAEFAEQALAPSNNWMLDAGGGTLVFTAKTYLKAQRPIIVFDRSYEMLRCAKQRLEQYHGKLPEHIYLLQGDLLAPPFKAAVFSTIALMGVLHLFSQLDGLLKELTKLLDDEGSMFMTSLIGETMIGKKYLNALHKAGEVSLPRTSIELSKQLFDALGENIKIKTHNNMAYIVYS